MTATFLLLVALGADPFFSLPVHRDGGTGVYRGRVELDSQPFAGAIVTAVVPFTERPDGFCGSGERVACICQPAWDFAQQLDRRRLEPTVLARAVTGDGGVFVLDQLPARFGLWLDAPDAGSRYIAEPDDEPLFLVPPVFTEGDVRDLTLRPIANATVSVITPQHRVFEALTDANGRFAVGPLAGAPSWVFIRREGYQPRAAKTENRPLLLGPPNMLKARVRDEDGGAAAGVAVETVDLLSRCVGRATTDPNGEAVIEHLAGGESGFGRHIVIAGRPLFGDLELNLPASGQASLVLHPTAALSIDFAGADAGRPSPLWATVHCPGLEAVTVNQHLTMGALTPGACAVDFENTRRWVALDAGEPTQLLLRSSPPQEYPVDVKVIDARGRSIDPRLWVQAAGDSLPGRQLETWTGGASKLHAGTWVLGIDDSELTCPPVKITVPGTKKVVLHAVRRPPLTGTLREADGQPIAHAHLDLDLGTAQFDTNAAGRFTGETPENGSHAITGWLTTGALHRTIDFKVELPRWAPMSLTAEPLLRTSGRLVTSNGEPVQLDGLRLSRDGDALTYTEPVVKDGGFDLVLPPGTYAASTSQRGPSWVRIDGTVIAGARHQPLLVRGPVRARGRLADANGQPITDFAFAQQPMHDDAGTFDVPSLPGAALSLNAGDAGVLRLEVPEHDVDYGTLIVGPPSFQTVRVVGPGDVPVPGAQLEAVSGRWADTDHTHWPYCESEPIVNRVDAYGVGVVSARPAELIRVHAPGYPFVEVKPGESTARLAPGAGAIHGRVLLNRKPERNVEVCVIGNDRWLRLVTDVEGRFAASGLSDGPHSYFVSHEPGPGWQRTSAEGHFTVVKAKDLALTVELKPTR